MKHSRSACDLVRQDNIIPAGLRILSPEFWISSDFVFVCSVLCSCCLWQEKTMSSCFQAGYRLFMCEMTTVTRHTRVFQSVSTMKHYRTRNDNLDNRCAFPRSAFIKQPQIDQIIFVKTLRNELKRPRKTSTMCTFYRLFLWFVLSWFNLDQ